MKSFTNFQRSILQSASVTCVQKNCENLWAAWIQICANRCVQKPLDLFFLNIVLVVGSLSVLITLFNLNYSYENMRFLVGYTYAPKHSSSHDLIWLLTEITNWIVSIRCKLLTIPCQYEVCFGTLSCWKGGPIRPNLVADYYCSYCSE